MRRVETIRVFHETTAEVPPIKGRLVPQESPRPYVGRVCASLGLARLPVVDRFRSLGLPGQGGPLFVSTEPLGIALDLLLRHLGA